MKDKEEDKTARKASFLDSDSECAGGGGGLGDFFVGGGGFRDFFLECPVFFLEELAVCSLIQADSCHLYYQQSRQLE